MRVLVTGGAGFLGSHLVRALVAADDVAHVTTFDALTYAGDTARLAGLPEHRHRLLAADVTDPVAVAAAVADVDVVCHLAAETHVDRSIEHSAPFVRTNVEGALHVLDACRHAERRLLHVSTDEVHGPIPAPRRASADDPVAPTNPYAASKAAAELLAASHRATYGQPVTVVRPTNAYGPWQLPEKFIPRAITTLLDGGAVPVYGDGSQRREWTHADDTVDALLALLRAGLPDGVFPVGAGQEPTNLEVAELLTELLDRPGAVVQVDDRPGHDRRYAVDSSPIRDLGWRPKVTLEGGLADTVAWFRAHERWWRPLVASGVTDRRGLR